MDELAKKARLLGKRLEPQWQDHHLNASLSRLHAQMRHQAQRRKLGVIASSALGAIALAWITWPHSEKTEMALRAEQDTPMTTSGSLFEERTFPANASLRLPDGSQVTATEDRTKITVAKVSPHQIRVRLRAGSARFAVAKNPLRDFSVDASDVHVHVIGTTFSVSRNEFGVRVNVIEGKVRVQSPNQERVLLAGQSETFSQESRNATLDEPAIEAKPTKAARTSPRPDTLEDVLAKADIARLSDKPQEAVELLRRALALGLRPSRKAIAEFTLARILLDDLHNPSAAAEAFARARLAVPNGPLAEDALAREVEAWAKAGAHDHARQRAEEYEQQFPQGRRRRLVRRYREAD